MSRLEMHLGERSYPITVAHGALARVGELFDLKRRVLILTDSGVPQAYVRAVQAACETHKTVVLEPGEANKCPETLVRLWRTCLEAGFDRNDAVVTVGGGVIGDLGGLVAATYMRGIAFYNLPTTLLAMVDSSVGGKVAIDLDGYKNIVGAFYQPRAVLIDPDVLETLDARQFGCGMAEMIKMFACADAETFARMEQNPTGLPIADLICAALRIKMQVVEADEKESGLRRVLNFGHTVGHAVESIGAQSETPLLHGECVGIGMLALCKGEVKERIAALLAAYRLPAHFTCTETDFRVALAHDKKSTGDRITTVRVPEIGQFTLQKESLDTIVSDSREVISFL